MQQPSTTESQHQAGPQTVHSVRESVFPVKGPDCPPAGNRWTKHSQQPQGTAAKTDFKLNLQLITNGLAKTGHHSI